MVYKVSQIIPRLTFGSLQCLFFLRFWHRVIAADGLERWWEWGINSAGAPLREEGLGGILRQTKDDSPILIPIPHRPLSLPQIWLPILQKIF